MPPRNGINRAMPGLCIGVDPGASGGLACLSLTGAIAIPMPKTERDVWDWVKIHQLGREPFAAIEKVSGYIGEAQPGSAAFKFGQSYGSLRMALTAAGIPFEEVTPQAWQKALGITPRKKAKTGVGGESKTQWKNRLKAHAQRLFPGVAITLATADAILISEWLRRRRENAP